MCVCIVKETGGDEGRGGREEMTEGGGGGGRMGEIGRRGGEEKEGGGGREGETGRKDGERRREEGEWGKGGREVQYFPYQWTTSNRLKCMYRLRSLVDLQVVWSCQKLPWRSRTPSLLPQSYSVHISSIQHNERVKL